MRARCWLVMALALTGCATAVTPPPPPVISSADALLARLPDRVGAFTRGGTTPLTEPGPGSEVAYSTQNRAAAGYVQILRRSQLLDAQAAGAELGRFVAESTTGTARRLRERGQAQIGGFSCTELDGTYGRQAVEALACVGGFGGQLVRLRLSMARRGERMADARAFAEGVSAALR